ncbi:hypothetical protein SAMN04244548_00333 [Paracoccus pantotrophus]|nr:hypothetical protein SAMN04244548_00333 [Paracoccus pantotrophus]
MRAARTASPRLGRQAFGGLEACSPRHRLGHRHRDRGQAALAAPGLTGRRGASARGFRPRAPHGPRPLDPDGAAADWRLAALGTGQATRHRDRGQATLAALGLTGRRGISACGFRPRATRPDRVPSTRTVRRRIWGLQPSARAKPPGTVTEAGLAAAGRCPLRSPHEICQPAGDCSLRSHGGACRPSDECPLPPPARLAGLRTNGLRDPMVEFSGRRANILCDPLARFASPRTKGRFGGTDPQHAASEPESQPCGEPRFRRRGHDHEGGPWQGKNAAAKRVVFVGECRDLCASPAQDATEGRG